MARVRQPGFQGWLGAWSAKRRAQRQARPAGGPSAVPDPKGKPNELDRTELAFIRMVCGSEMDLPPANTWSAISAAVPEVDKSDLVSILVRAGQGKKTPLSRSSGPALAKSLTSFMAKELGR